MKFIEPIDVATAVVRKKGTEKYLLAKRTKETDIQPGKWNFPGGKIEKKDSKPSGAAQRELFEETEIEEQPVRTGESFMVNTVDGKFRVHPVLFKTEEEPELNSEHTEYRWIKSEQLDEFQTVKGLKQDLRRLDNM